jgi:hypothetical protein
MEGQRGGLGDVRGLGVGRQVGLGVHEDYWGSVSGIVEEAKDSRDEERGEDGKREYWLERERWCVLPK